MGQAGLAQDQKGARRRGAWICFQDESGFSLLPVVRGTWAPRGQTPVLQHRFSWSRMSMAGVLAYRPDRSRAKLIFQTKPGSYNTESLIEFLTQLRRHLRGKPIVLIWDGLSAHRSKDMKAWLATQQHWLTVEGLPGYAHDLNPMELVWGNLKVRHEAPPIRAGMEGPRLRSVAADRVKLGAADSWRRRGTVASSPDNAGTCRYCQTVRVRQA